MAAHSWAAIFFEKKRKTPSQLAHECKPKIGVLSKEAKAIGISAQKTVPILQRNILKIVWIGPNGRRQHN